MPREYRSRTRITLDILRTVKEEPGLGATRLLTVANLSTERLNGYASELVARGLLEERMEAGKRTYHLTPEGQRLLTELDRIDRFMGDFGMTL